MRPDQPQRAGEDRSGFARVRYLTNAIPRLAVSVFVISAAASMLIIYSSPDQSLNPVSWTVGVFGHRRRGRTALASAPASGAADCHRARRARGRGLIPGRRGS